MDVFKKMRFGAVVALCAVAVQAHNTNTSGQCGIARTTSAYTSGSGSFNLGVSVKGEYDPKFIYNTDVFNVKSSEEAGQLLSEGIFFCYGVNNIFDFNMQLPIYQDVWKDKTNAAGIGDFELAVKFSHSGLDPNAAFRVGYLFKVFLPTGTDESGYFQRHSFYTMENQTPDNKAFTGGGFGLNPMMVWTIDGMKTSSNVPIFLHGNFGAYTQTGDNRKNSDGYGFIGNLALEYFALKNLTTYIELYGESRLLNYINGRGFSLRSLNNDALVASIGMNHKFNNGSYLDYSFSYALTDHDFRRAKWVKTDDKNAKYYYSTAQAAQYGFQLTLGFAKIGEKADTDGDRIPNIKDRCPEQPEDYDGYEDDDGCPDLVHSLPHPDTVIVRNVVTKSDTVVLIKRDTVRAELPMADSIISYGIITLQSVNFATNRAELKSVSNNVLNDIATSLVRYPKVRLEIRGYCDNRGSYELNNKLSADRARAVANYLISKGIARDRLQCVGMGSADPVGDNSSVDGRMLNRRVELKRID